MVIYTSSNYIVSFYYGLVLRLYSLTAYKMRRR